MKTIKYISLLVAIGVISGVSIANASIFDSISSWFDKSPIQIFGAPSPGTYQSSLFPINTTTTSIGSSTRPWPFGYFTNASSTISSATTICLTGDSCRTTWPTGGGTTITQLGQIPDVSTSTLSYGHLIMWDGTKWQDTATSSLGITGTGTVTSVAMTVPTGLTISGSPITTSGTLGLTLTSGYNFLTNNASTTWDLKQNAIPWGTYDPYGQATSTLTSHTTTYNHASFLTGTKVDSLNSLTGALTITGTTPLTFRSSDLNISIATSSALVSGFLTTTDWNTFNNKLGSGGSITSGTITNASTTYLTVGNTAWINKLNVTNTTSTSTITGGLTVGNNAALSVDRNAAVNSLFIDPSGNVGIGTTSPLYKLDINNEIGNSAGDLKIQPDVQGNVVLFGDTNVADDADGKSLVIWRKAAEGDASINLGISQYKSFLVTYSGGTMGFDSGSNRLRYQYLADGNVEMFDLSGAGDTRELLIYGYRTGDASRQLQIGVGVDAADTASFDGVSNYYFDGNVGIGTVSPAQKLSVTGNGAFSGTLSASSTAYLPTLVTTNGTITNASTTYATLPTFWSSNANITGGTITGITDLVVADGGTGAGTFTDHGLLYGQATVAIGALAVGTTGQILTGSTGAIPVWSATPSITTLTATNGTFTNATSTASLFIPAIAGLTLSQSGQIGIDSTTGNLKFRNGGATQVLTATSSVSFTIASTTANEFIPIKTFDQPATIKGVSCVNSDIGSPSVTFNLAHGTSIKSTVTTFAPSLTNTSTTTNTDYFGTFNDNTLAANETMVATTSASTATGFFNCSVFYWIDN